MVRASDRCGTRHYTGRDRVGKGRARHCRTGWVVIAWAHADRLAEGSVSMRATKVDVSEDALTVELDDGRTIAAPLAWFPRLVHATAEERRTWRLIANGRDIHWPA